MSFKKAELMSIGKSTSPKPIVPLGNEGNIKVVEHCKYLGAFSSADGTNVKELNNRIGKAAGAFRESEEGWKKATPQLTTLGRGITMVKTCSTSPLLNKYAL